MANLLWLDKWRRSKIFNVVARQGNQRLYYLRPAGSLLTINLVEDNEIVEAIEKTNSDWKIEKTLLPYPYSKVVVCLNKPADISGRDVAWVEC